MKNNFISLCCKEPYRLFFPAGTFFLIWGAFVWLPQIWSPGDYPVLAHRYLMLNGFVGSFVAGFLMTAIPKFSRTQTARMYEVILFFLITIAGLVAAYRSMEKMSVLFSAGQSISILSFLFTRIFKRQENPPYSFIFIFIGLFLWAGSDIMKLISDDDVFLRLHYEGAIMAIILGVGSRLLPGIFGHTEIVAAQRKLYEQPVGLLSTVPAIFFVFILTFTGSYFLSEETGAIVRAVVVSAMAFQYWKLTTFPKEKSALTWSLWTCGWMIVLSFILRAVWNDGIIHAGHAFFLSGIVLLCLLIATRVLQSHGPRVKSLEESSVLYAVSGLLILAAITRVTAYLLPEQYLRHLGYSAFILVFAVIIWAIKFLRYAPVSQ